MITGELDRQLNGSDSSNDLVPLLLGLRTLLNELANSVEHASTAPASRPTLSPDDDLVVLAFLGLLSVRRTLRRWIEPEIPTSAAEAGSITAGASPDLIDRGLLR